MPAGEEVSACSTVGRDANATTPISPLARTRQAAAVTAAVAKRAPFIEPDASMSRHSAICGRAHATARNSSVFGGPRLGPRGDDRVEGPVEVQIVAAVDRHDPPLRHAPRGRRATAGLIEHQSRHDPPYRRA